MQENLASRAIEPQTCLLVDDDEVFCRVMAEALRRRGLAVHIAHDVALGVELAQRVRPAYAIVDLKLPQESGLHLVRSLRSFDTGMRILVLTGYASIATAVEAIKLGATNYLTKPADAEEVLAALQHADGTADEAVAARPMSVDRLAWEHIQKVLAECAGNVSETARRLGMHRRTLQRKLSKRPVKS